MRYLATVLIILVMLAGWLLVRAAARRYAARHPEFGALREEGEGCGCGNHRCGEAECKRQAH
jgi:hypothetical protein